MKRSTVIKTKTGKLAQVDLSKITTEDRDVHINKIKIPHGVEFAVSLEDIKEITEHKLADALLRMHKVSYRDGQYTLLNYVTSFFAAKKLGYKNFRVQVLMGLTEEEETILFEVFREHSQENY